MYSQIGWTLKYKSSSNSHVDMPFFYTEEGRYLASSLGDPLIKGLTEVANKRPEDPIAYLATYLYNFANNDKSRSKVQETEQTITGPPEDIDNNNAVPTTIEVVTVDPDNDNVNEEESAFNKTSRDEHGQSMLHFAAARSHGRNALFQLLVETEINLSYRDELYRTARDISIQANIPENTNEIDRYILHIACNGETDKLVELLLNGYDHITDVVDEDDIPIIEAVSTKGQTETVSFLQSILTFEEKRERVHHAIRQGVINEVTALLADEKDTGSGKLLAIGKNSYGRCTLHIAVLCQQEEIVDYLVNTFPDTLHVGDNVTLGDPLIKGLTEVANKRPEDPIAYLATYLYNFANNDKSRSKVQLQETEQTITGPPEDIDNNNAVPTTIEVVTVDPDNDNVNEEESAFNKTSRDEHGQSMLHFAAARSHGRNALFQLLVETEINLSYRDELYRTARDISIQANIPENTNEIDRYILHIACNGETDKLVELLLNGYDHITDVVDEDDIPIIEAVSTKGQTETVSFLQSILTFEEKRERVHHAIRQGVINEVTALLADEKDTGSGKLLAIGKNSYGRCTLHIAVLCQQEEIVDYLVNTFPDTLHVGDNLERTALHYSMGVEKMETINKLLIKGGAKRVVKDLKGRQPSYYFMNKSDVLRLQEEEETF
ncbi:hypothetical protein FQA39_LY02599 [Lamprigera yunnana]|nr:hypothetical protein FQA39_LY02599 [Lamprigera yunnana]